MCCNFFTIICSHIAPVSCDSQQENVLATNSAVTMVFVWTREDVAIITGIVEMVLMNLIVHQNLKQMGLVGCIFAMWCLQSVTILFFFFLLFVLFFLFFIFYSIYSNPSGLDILSLLVTNTLAQHIYQFCFIFIVIISI